MSGGSVREEDVDKGEAFWGTVGMLMGVLDQPGVWKLAAADTGAEGVGGGRDAEYELWNRV